MKKKILYLYTRLIPYQIPVFSELVKTYDCEVFVFHWKRGNVNPYVPDDIDGINYYDESELSLKELFYKVSDISPDLVFISGWQDKRYLLLALYFRLKKVSVVTGFDDIWTGSLRQWFGRVLINSFGALFFSDAWVSGPRQFEYARKMGFRNDNIMYYLYSGDTSLFTDAFARISKNRSTYPKSFLFVGRLVEDKGVDILLKAFTIYKQHYKGTWNLICVGNGPLDYLFDNLDNVEHINFSNQRELVEIIGRSGAFVLPSRFDVSPLVVHEMTAAGLPLILSKAIGNRLLFLIDGYNGISFESNSFEDLAMKMHQLSLLDNDILENMGQKSNELSLQHNSKHVAASLYALLKFKRQL
jgi:glycosyltransferase involved in cell wall biosynthesis